jgi:hypothetical protein
MPRADLRFKKRLTPIENILLVSSGAIFVMMAAILGDLEVTPRDQRAVTGPNRPVDLLRLFSWDQSRNS